MADPSRRSRSKKTEEDEISQLKTYYADVDKFQLTTADPVKETDEEREEIRRTHVIFEAWSRVNSTNNLTERKRHVVYLRDTLDELGTQIERKAYHKWLDEQEPRLKDDLNMRIGHKVSIHTPTKDEKPVRSKKPVRHTPRKSSHSSRSEFRKETNYDHDDLDECVIL